MKLYQIDFLLKQKLDQFASLFNIEESKDPKAKSPKLPTGASFIVDPEGKEWWCKAFGENVILKSNRTLIHTDDNGSLELFLPSFRVRSRSAIERRRRVF